MGFQKLADLYEELEQTSSGNKMREILAEFFKKVPEDDIAVIAYLTLGQIASEYKGVVLGMAEKSALKAIAKAAGVDEIKVKKTMQEAGDAGLTAEKLLQKKPLTLVPVGKFGQRIVRKTTQNNKNYRSRLTRREGKYSGQSSAKSISKRS